MFVFLVSGIVLFAVCSPALAQQDANVRDMLPHLTHWAITLLGIGVAARLALQTFGRAVTVADVPTFPRYMASRQLYRLGSWLFVIFACSFFLLLVYEHRQVVAVLPHVGWIPENMLKAVQDQSAPYLLIVSVMGIVYLYALTKEAQWNVVLMMRDVIHSWICVPELAKQIIAQIRFSLRVPQHVLSEVIATSAGVMAPDFHKDPNTPDRIWAEICYMKWWLVRGHDAGEDATFFTEESFGFDALMEEFQQASWAMGQWKAGAAVDLATSNLAHTIKDLHNRFSRLVACYLIYRNGSREELSQEAKRFGIELDAPVSENPLRYWVVYIIALMASVYLGVHVSAISYDLFSGKGLILTQDPDRAMAWVMYSLSNYGVAIVIILLLRFVAMTLGSSLHQSHLITYCWTFLVAFVGGPLALTIAVHVFGPAMYAGIPLDKLYFQMLKWGLGPAMVSVYISYYLDRQTYQDLPNIDHSRATLGWRLLNCFGFAAITLFLLLPYLLSLNAQHDAAWDTSKLRFVATGTTFCLVLGLAAAAQFALRKPAQGTGGADMPTARVAVGS